MNKNSVSVYIENKEYFDRKINESFLACFVAKNLKDFFEKEKKYTLERFFLKSLNDMTILLSKKISSGVVSFDREKDGLNNQEFIESAQNLLLSCYNQALDQLKIPNAEFDFIDDRIDSGRASQDLIEMLEFYRDKTTFLQ